MRSAIHGPSSRSRRSRARASPSTATIASPAHSARRARPRFPRRLVERRARRARGGRQRRAQARLPPEGRADLHHPLEDGSRAPVAGADHRERRGAPRAPAPHRARAGAARRPRALGSPSARGPASKLSVPLETEAGLRITASDRSTEAPAEDRATKDRQGDRRPCPARRSGARLPNRTLDPHARRPACRSRRRPPHGPRRVLPFDHRLAA